MTEVYRVGYLERLPLGTPYPGERPHYPNKRTGWLPSGAAGLCQSRTQRAVHAATINYPGVRFRY
jgi:hypothetical protein